MQRPFNGILNGQDFQAVQLTMVLLGKQFQCRYLNLPMNGCLLYGFEWFRERTDLCNEG